MHDRESRARDRLARVREIFTILSTRLPSCGATDFYGPHKNMRPAYINISRLEIVNLLVPPPSLPRLPPVHISRRDGILSSRL